MLFPTATFAIFFLIVLPLSWLTMPKVHRWRPFILVASYVFYSWWDWRFIFLLAGCTIWNQLLAVRIHRATAQSQRKLLLALALAGEHRRARLLQVLRLLRRLVAEHGGDRRARAPALAATIILPVGISFYTFMAISYVVDTYRGDFVPTTLEKFAVYLSFFPHLVAGPIVRPGELIPQFDEPRNPRRVDTSRAFYLIATGLFKKVVIANYLAANIVDQVFGAPGQHSSLEILIGIYAYAVQIYADFSGYTDIAIGLALLLGFTFPPQLRLAVRRHLAAGLLAPLAHDPLALPARLPLHPARRQPQGQGDHLPQPDADDADRGPLARRGLDVRRLGRDPRGRARRRALAQGPPGLRRPARHAARAGSSTRLITFNIVCLAWVFFRADSFATAWDLLTGLFTGWGTPSPLVTGGVLLAIAVGIGSQYLPARFPYAVMDRFGRLPVVGQAVVLAFALMLTNTLGPEGVAPFIYFRF